jgi:hypothetical protein
MTTASCPPLLGTNVEVSVNELGGNPEFDENVVQPVGSAKSIEGVHGDCTPSLHATGRPSNPTPQLFDLQKISDRSA